MAKKISLGDKLPTFKVQDHEGFTLKNDDFIGMPIVFYFYPKDDTPGCTQEACSFRDHMDKLDQLEAVTVGISPDSIESHKNFIEKNKLNFTLLADEKKEMCEAFGVLQDGKVVRSTFVADADGQIQWMESPVKIEGHVERVIAAVKKYKDETEEEQRKFLQELEKKRKLK